jgi:hypothetical protein
LYKERLIKKLISYCFIPIVLCLIGGCKDNPVETSQSYGLKYERNGLIDSLTGDCSVVVTHSFILDSLDFRGVSKVKMNYLAHTDADISFLRLFYLNADTAVNVVSLEGAAQISNANSIEFDAPQMKELFFVRLGLRSSVCTGDIFHLKLRDLKIYTR